jgi:hypothetical protein
MKKPESMDNIEKLHSSEYANYVLLKIEHSYLIVDHNTGYKVFTFKYGEDASQQEIERLESMARYWAAHLNMAYAAGFVARDGKFVHHTEESYKNLTELYIKAYL